MYGSTRARCLCVFATLPSLLLAGCAGETEQTPPSTAAPAAMPASTPTAYIHINKRSSSDDCDLEKVVPPVFPQARAGDGDPLIWEVHRKQDCDGIAYVLLTRFYRNDDCSTEKTPLDCNSLGTAANEGDFIDCTVRLDDDDTLSDRDWEYDICAYDDAKTAVDVLDPKLQTRGGGAVVPPAGAPEDVKNCFKNGIDETDDAERAKIRCPNYPEEEEAEPAEDGADAAPPS